MKIFRGIFIVFMAMLLVGCSQPKKERSVENIGENVEFQDTITIQGKSGSWLLNLAASELMRSNYVVTYQGVVEAVLGDSIKIAINGYKVEMVATNGKTSVAQHEDLPQANSIASQMIGKSLAVKKDKVTLVAN